MPGAAQAAVESAYGVVTVTRDNPLNVDDIDIAAKQILPVDPDRLGLTIINLGPVAIFVKWDSDVSSTNGIRLGANGGSVTLQVPEDADRLVKQWFATAAANNTDFFVSETVAV